MATGSGKTVVMAMLIAWQTINKVFAPRDVRFTNRFLVITPEITIRDRLRVLRPSDPGNYYWQRDLIPPDLEGALHQAQVAITNYHAFLPRSSSEMKGVSTKTRKFLLAGKSDDPFKESSDAVVTRVLRELGMGGGRNQIVVLNDEAHHCYRNRPIADATVTRGGRCKRGNAGVVSRHPDHCEHCWCQTGLRPIGDPVLAVRFGLSRGLYLPLGCQRFRPDGRHRVRHREGAPHPRR